MAYLMDVHPKCQNEIDKLCKKNPVLEHALKNKMHEILGNPNHYKPLKYELAGERSAHIMKSFVLKFEIDETNKRVTFLAFSHHDDAYRR